MDTLLDLIKVFQNERRMERRGMVLLHSMFLNKEDLNSIITLMATGEFLKPPIRRL